MHPLAHAANNRFLLLASLFAMLALPASFTASSVAARQASPAPAVRYAVQDLGTLGGLRSQGFEVNKLGHVAGFSELTTVPGATPTTGPVGAALPAHAFLWRDGAMIDLGTLGGLGSLTYALNDADQVVGGADTADGKHHAFLWDNGQMTDLGTLGGDNSEAIGINNHGLISGYSTTVPGQQLGDPGTHAFIWQDGVMTDIGTLGGDFSRANLNNDAGQVVGASEVADGSIHPFLWQNGTMTDLGTLPGFTSTRAIRISENGIICGFAYDPVGTPEADAIIRHGFVYRDGQFTDLGLLGGVSAGCGDVNDHGQVTGASTIGDDPSLTHGILWQDGTLTDINDLLMPGSGWEITQAVGFNSLGQIAGFGLRDGIEHALLLTPQT